MNQYAMKYIDSERDFISKTVAANKLNRTLSVYTNAMDIFLLRSTSELKAHNGVFTVFPKDVRGVMKLDAISELRAHPGLVAKSS